MIDALGGMRLRLVAAILFAVVPLGPVSAEERPVAGTARDAFRSAIEAVLDASRLPGASIRWIEPDGSVERLDFGFADVAQNVPITADTRLAAGSISKLVTALLVLRAEAAGVLSLDELLERYVPGGVTGEGASDVTIAHLLEHTAGLPGTTYREYGAKASNASPADYVDHYGPLVVRWPPGLHFSYANGGTTLAGRAVEVAWGADFDTLVEREVLRPLGMRTASFASRDGIAESYADDGRTPEDHWAMPVRPAGSLVTTADDLMRVMQMLLARGRLPDGSAFLPEAAIARMERSETSLAARAGAKAGSYGLGNFLFVAGGATFRGHWGRTEGFQANFGYRPEDGGGFLIMANGADRRGMAELRRVFGARWADPPASPGEPPALERLGVFVQATHEMPMRSWIFELVESVRISRSADEGWVRVGSPWSWGSGGEIFYADSPGLYRNVRIRTPTATFVEQGDGLYWVDGSSFRRVSSAAFYASALAVFGGLFASVVALLVGIVLYARYGLREAGLLPWALLGVGGTGYLVLVWGFVNIGLLSGLTSSAELGSATPVALGLAAASVVGPAASIGGMALVGKAGRLRRTAWIVGAGICALGLRLAAVGWLPLCTWCPS
ncbi:MAG: serine hydrolase domain-containing protein [Myxococcota bacterium]